MVAQEFRGLPEDHARRAPVAADDVVGHEAVAAHHELERALALADAALAEQESPHPEDVDEHTVQLQARREAVVEDGVQRVDGPARARVGHEQRSPRRLRGGDERARRLAPSRHDDARQPEREEPARREAARLVAQRIQVRQLGLAEHLNARRDHALVMARQRQPVLLHPRMAQRAFEPRLARDPIQPDGKPGVFDELAHSERRDRLALAVPAAPPPCLLRHTLTPAHTPALP